jgi:hypothetical protein
MSRITSALRPLASGVALAAAASLLAAVPASAAPSTAGSAAATYAPVSISGPAHDVAGPIVPAVVPTRDVVGLGLIQCKAATGEVGYDPASKAGVKGPLYIMIWFQFTGCSAQSPKTKGPVPRTVVGSISFFRPQGNGCPLLGGLGTGVLNLSYNFPPVPAPVMIDPSAALKVSVSQSTAFWVLKGVVDEGSYKGAPLAPFTWQVKPDVIGLQNCRAGITSEYIIRSNGLLKNI